MTDHPPLTPADVDAIERYLSAGDAATKSDVLALVAAVREARAERDEARADAESWAEQASDRQRERDEALARAEAAEREANPDPCECGGAGHLRDTEYGQRERVWRARCVLAQERSARAAAEADNATLREAQQGGRDGE